MIEGTWLADELNGFALNEESHQPGRATAKSDVSLVEATVSVLLAGRNLPELLTHEDTPG